MQWPALEGMPAEQACREHPAATTQLANYLTHMAGGLGNTLFDSRRRTCHSLILNYFVAGGGLKVLLDHFSLTVELLSAANRLPAVPEPSGESPSLRVIVKVAALPSHAIPSFLRVMPTASPAPHWGSSLLSYGTNL